MRWLAGVKRMVASLFGSHSAGVSPPADPPPAIAPTGGFAIPPDGDPEKDVPKELCIDYVLNGETHSVTYKENENVDLQVGH